MFTHGNLSIHTVNVERVLPCAGAVVVVVDVTFHTNQSPTRNDNDSTAGKVDDNLVGHYLSSPNCVNALLS